ncbi:hypothetical protein D3C71_1046940 [compost metagenome]
MGSEYAAGAIVVHRLQVHTGAVVFGLIKVGEQAGVVRQRPVDRGAVLHLVSHLATRHTENHPRVQQEVDGGAGGHVAISLLAPVAKQLAFLAGEQVIAPAAVLIAPVGGFVYQLLSCGSDLTVFDQAHFHFVDPARQGARIESLQAGIHRLGIDQQAVAKDLHRGLTVGGDVDRVNAGLGAVDGQAVGAAVHQACRRIGAGAERTRLTAQPFGVGGEIAQTQEAAFEFTLGKKLVHRVVELIVRATQTCQLHVQTLGPVAQATAGFQAIASAEVLLLATVEVQLITHDQAGTAAFGQIVIPFGIRIALGVFGGNRHQ